MTERDDEIDSTPREKRRGWLRNGNPPGDFSTAPRCGAKHGRYSERAKAERRYSRNLLREFQELLARIPR
jgi:hypothetical protein